MINKKSSKTEKADMITREGASSPIREEEIADLTREVDHSNPMREETADRSKEGSGKIRRAVRPNKLVNNSAAIDRAKEDINKISNRRMDRSRGTLCSR